jgi:hypothetical protein
MLKAIKFTVILCLFLVLFVPNLSPEAAASGPRISHVCVDTGSPNTIVLVVWPGAPGGLTGAIGSLSVSSSSGTFTIPLVYDHTNGTAAKWFGVVPSGSYTGNLVITSGWVLDPSDTVQNLPFTFQFGKSCNPTAVTLNSLSAASQNRSPVMLDLTLVLMAVGLIVIKRH